MHHELFLDGTWRPGAAGRIVTTDPATGAPLADVAHAGPADVACAVASARAAVADGRWAATTAGRRAQVLHDLAALLDGRAADVARWETLDGGRPITVTRLFGVPAAVESTRRAATAVLRFSARRRGPRVVAVVVRAEAPFAALVATLLTALVDGDAVVVAPSEHTPLCALLLAELTAEAGLPAGVLGVVTGGPDVARQLVAHPGVDRVVTATADLAAPAAAVVAADGDVGEMLSCNPFGGLHGVGRYAPGYRHVDVHVSRAEEFVAALTATVLALRVGRGRETTTDCGPLPSRAARDTADHRVRAAVGAGADVVVGSPLPPGPLTRGWFRVPTVLVGGCHERADDPDGAPVVRVAVWEHPAELVTGRPRELWSGDVVVWSDDLSTAHRLGATVGAARVLVNAGPVVESDAVWPAPARRAPTQTREPGLDPRYPGSRQTGAAATPARRSSRGPVPAPARPTAGDVPAAWGGQGRRPVVA